MTVDVDKLPATQELVLEVLAARHRLGEQVWTMSRKQGVTKALTELQKLGLVNFDSGVVEDTWLASLTTKGREAVLSPRYRPPFMASMFAEWMVRYATEGEGPHDRGLPCDTSRDAERVYNEMVTGLTRDGLRRAPYLPRNVSIWRRLVGEWQQQDTPEGRRLET
jgi:hypothetical protein